MHAAAGLNYARFRLANLFAAHPLILVNFKVYPTATGAAAVRLAQLCARVAAETGAQIGVAVGALDLAAVAAAVSLPVFAQHTDAVPLGAHTGHISPAAVRAAGAVGTLLNHSEHRLPAAKLAETVVAARAAGLQTVVCAESAAEVATLAALQPDYLAVEPPELIGGNVAVTTAQPAVITAAVAAAAGVPVLVGAGVKSGADTAAAQRLGAAGVLLASGVTAAADPAAVLRDLIQGFHAN